MTVIDYALRNEKTMEDMRRVEVGEKPISNDGNRRES